MNPRFVCVLARQSRRARFVCVLAVRTAKQAGPVCVCLGGKDGKAGGICARHRRRPRSRSFRRSGRAANELRVPFYFTFLLHKVCYATCRRWIFRGSTSSAVPPCALGLQPLRMPRVLLATVHTSNSVPFEGSWTESLDKALAYLFTTRWDK